MSISARLRPHVNRQCRWPRTTSAVPPASRRIDDVAVVLRGDVQLGLAPKDTPRRLVAPGASHGADAARRCGR